MKLTWGNTEQGFAVSKDKTINKNSAPKINLYKNRKANYKDIKESTKIFWDKNGKELKKIKGHTKSNKRLELTEKLTWAWKSRKIIMNQYKTFRYIYVMYIKLCWKKEQAKK